MRMMKTVATYNTDQVRCNVNIIESGIAGGSSKQHYYYCEMELIRLSDNMLMRSAVLEASYDLDKVETWAICNAPNVWAVAHCGINVGQDDLREVA